MTIRTFNAEEIFEDIPGDPDNVIMNLPLEICQELDWRKGDILNITITNKGTIEITKMAKNSELLELEGQVIEVLPNSTFRVKVSNMEHQLICYMGGRLKQNKIKVILGDAVRLEVSPYDLSKGRITFRL